MPSAYPWCALYTKVTLCHPFKPNFINLTPRHGPCDFQPQTIKLGLQTTSKWPVKPDPRARSPLTSLNQKSSFKLSNEWTIRPYFKPVTKFNNLASNTTQKPGLLFAIHTPVILKVILQITISPLPHLQERWPFQPNSTKVTKLNHKPSKYTPNHPYGLFSTLLSLSSPQPWFHLLILHICFVIPTTWSFPFFLHKMTGFYDPFTLH